MAKGGPRETKQSKQLGKGLAGPVFCWSFQSDFTNEMGKAIEPDEPEATASIPPLPETAVLAVSL